MDWSEYQKELTDASGGVGLRRSIIEAIATRAVELVAARGGTMTAEELDDAIREMVDRAPSLSVAIDRHISALGARNAVLEARCAHVDAEASRIAKARDEALAERDDAILKFQEVAEQLATDQRSLSVARTALEQATIHVGELEMEVKRLSECAAVTETMALRREVSELKARCATLSAAGQVVSAHMDKPDGHEDCPDNPCPAYFPYCEGANRDTPQRHPCSQACTHDDAAKPGHPERVKERSEVFSLGTFGMSPDHPVATTLGEVERVREIARGEGAEAMRAACLEAIIAELVKEGNDHLIPRYKVAIEGVVP